MIFKRALCFLAGILSGFQVSATDGHVAFGETVPPLRFKDIRFIERSLEDLGAPSAFVFVFTTLDCPLVSRYLPKLETLHQEFQPKKVSFLAVNVGSQDSLTEIAYQAVEHGISFPFVKDIDWNMAKALGVERTPGVVVLDEKRRLVYRGRIDDQFRIGGARPHASRSELREVLDAVVHGRESPLKETPVDGCAITFSEPSPPVVDPTYALEIAPILNRHCVECHRPATEAPFALTSYDLAVSKARMIAEVVSDQSMPPWYAHPKFGDFKNSRRLNAEEIQLVVAWARGKRLSGDLTKAPPPPEFPESIWKIGKPDLVITASKEEKIPATGYVDYRYVILPHVFLHDTWVQGVQIQPGNLRVVHHANLAYASLGKGYDESTSFITGRVPGGLPVNLEEGVGMMIPKGSILALQIHYVTTGKEETDRISVGLRFARGTIQKKVRYKIIADYRFEIPPEAPAHRVSAVRELECDAVGLGLFQHMHLRGRDTTFIAHYPGGRQEVILAIPNYNFDWQLGYLWEFGVQKFPKGTRIECRTHFDNSRFNPFNPNPLAAVRNGPQTHHEMMQGFFFYVDENERLELQIDPETGREKKPLGKE